MPNGVQFADALETHITGKNKIQRTVCLQTLQAFSACALGEIQEILMWAKQQQEKDPLGSNVEIGGQFQLVAGTNMDWSAKS